MAFLGDEDDSADDWNEQHSLLAAARAEEAKHAHSHGARLAPSTTTSTERFAHAHAHGAEGHGHAHGAEGHGHAHGAEGHGHAHGGEGHGHAHGAEGHGHAHGDESEGVDYKVVAFWSVGLLTLAYVIAELAIALSLHSLTLLSDGFHNLSDVISLYIAYWATQAAKRPLSDEMSFGWARTELLGALLNGTFLLALCLYTFLEAIPETITAALADAGPEGAAPSGSGEGEESSDSRQALMFIGVALGGLAVNTIGTVVFHFTGQSHGHSHAAGGHGHSHGGDDGGGGHGHSHGAHVSSAAVLAPAHLQVPDHLRSTNELQQLQDKRRSGGVAAGSPHDYTVQIHEDHVMVESKPKEDMNVRAVFLHYLGDMISSALVLVTGILLYFFGHEYWTGFLDPLTSLVIVVLILVTTVPLVKACSIILLQATPTELDVSSLKESVLSVPGVLNVHDLHCWQLVNGLPICSLHVAVEEGADFNAMVTRIKALLHQYGIHSSTIQPEFAHRFSQMGEQVDACEQNCIPGCEEDWCCEKK